MARRPWVSFLYIKSVKLASCGEHMGYQSLEEGNEFSLIDKGENFLLTCPADCLDLLRLKLKLVNVSVHVQKIDIIKALIKVYCEVGADISEIMRKADFLQKLTVRRVAACFTCN